MIQATRFILPAPTSVNAMYGKGWHKSQAYRAWIKEAGLTIMAARAKKPFTKFGPGWYCTLIEHTIAARYDVDNATKAIHDLLVEMQITPDDKFLWASCTARSVSVDHGSCIVTIWPMTDSPLEQVFSVAGLEIEGVIG